MGVPSMHYPGHTTNLRGGSLGLGSLPLSTKHGRIAGIGTSVIIVEDHGHLHTHRIHALGCGSGVVLGTAQVLPTTTRTHHVVLLVNLSTQDHPLVLPDRFDPKLLLVSTIWTKLDVPVQQRSGANIRNRAAGSTVLHWFLGRIFGNIRTAFQDALVDLAIVRHRTRSTKMGSNLVGDVQHWILPSLGWRSNIIGTAESKSLALAGHTGRHPGSGSRHDLVGNVNESARCIHIDWSASAWIRGDDGGTGVCTKQDRTGTDLT